ncbi:hypothetical protein BJX66DRAFT_68283 [Aspergillus keveii]|uniref:Uncharacterized protein n=1 Tax=Aspergillus keveii TaxID=714993 RepID=A0ABR4FQ07_9EURO
MQLHISSSTRKLSPPHHEAGAAPVLPVWEDSTEANQNDLHKNKGHCGEVTASHLYFLDNPHVHLKEQNARVATIVRSQATDPCGNAEGVSYPILYCGFSLPMYQV